MSIQKQNKASLRSRRARGVRDGVYSPVWMGSRLDGRKAPKSVRHRHGKPAKSAGIDFAGLSEWAARHNAR